MLMWRCPPDMEMILRLKKDKNVLHIGRFEPSTKMCHVCGYIKEDMTLSVRKWTCPLCGTEHDRDVNAAINIRNIAFDRQNLIGTSAHERNKIKKTSAGKRKRGRGGKR